MWHQVHTKLSDKSSRVNIKWEEEISVNKIHFSTKQLESFKQNEVDRRTGMIVNEQIEWSPSHAAFRRTLIAEETCNTSLPDSSPRLCKWKLYIYVLGVAVMIVSFDYDF